HRPFSGCSSSTTSNTTYSASVRGLRGTTAGPPSGGPVLLIRGRLYSGCGLSTASDRIARFYDDLVARYGDDPRACDYGSPASQATKFGVLSSVCDLTGLRVLDVGC